MKPSELDDLSKILNRYPSHPSQMSIGQVTSSMDRPQINIDYTNAINIQSYTELSLDQIQTQKPNNMNNRQLMKGMTRINQSEL